MKLHDVVERIPDTAAITSTARTTFGASGTGVVAALAGLNWQSIVAILVGVISLVANLYFQWRRNARERAHDRRLAELHQAQMDAIHNRCDL